MNALFPVTDATFRKIHMDGSTIKQWRAPELNLKSNVVCATCNNGWMSDIENLYAKPAMADLILGKRVGAISRKRARGISLFAFKTAVVANHSLPESELFFDQADRYAFRESFKKGSFRIPPDIAMWLVGMQPNFCPYISILGVQGEEKEEAHGTATKDGQAPDEKSRTANVG